MGKLNVQVGDTVYVKATVTEISKKVVKSGEDPDFYIDLEIPHWSNGTHIPNRVNLTWSQHLLFTPEGEEA